LAGGVSIGSDVYIGPNATITEDTDVGDNAVIGAGAVVMEDIPEETTAVGIPAEPVDS
jgi:acetyltransferase-like isoleucine patch superfamily enzyme